MYRDKSVLSKLILPVLMILLLISLAGCGSKQNNAGNSTGSTSNSQSTKTSSSSVAGGVTYENYLKIKLDSTYDDVKKILGEGGKKDISPDVVRYSWGISGKTINVEITKGKVSSKTQTMLGKTTSTITADQFKKVTKGMTFDQVVSILGPDYQESSLKRSDNATRRVVIWMKPDSKNVTVVFQDEKVSDLFNFLK